MREHPPQAVRSDQLVPGLVYSSAASPRSPAPQGLINPTLVLSSSSPAMQIANGQISEIVKCPFFAPRPVSKDASSHPHSVQGILGAFGEGH
jgi:hypothetical protein